MNDVQEVEIAGVERELARLWRAAASPASDAPAVLRACSLNLVVAGCGGEQEGLAQILQEVSARHPSRTILLSVEPGDARPPRAWVNMVCHRGRRGEPQVCSEQLVLAGPPAALHELVASVAGLLAADLPAFLWWRGRPPETEIEQERFHHLADVVDKVLLDSAGFDAAQLARAAALARSYRRVAFSDLNWARLTSWRAAVAQCFDPPARQALLPGLEKVRIFCAGSAPTSAARLMGGWLRSRLRASLPVALVDGPADLLELHSPGACFRIARPASPGDCAALSEEFRILGRDRVFEQALEAAV